ncbi:MAG: apolipoprotein N-acyltransferase [Flavobacteriales bacterium]
MAASRSRILLWSSLSGVLWALAWPAIGGFVPLAFVAWLPLLHAERLHDERTEGRRRAFAPYVLPALFIWNLACSWWFWCVSEPVSTKLVSVGAPVLVNTCFMLVPWWLKRMVRRRLGERQALIGFILFWLAMERMRHSGDLQWPWFSMGNVFATAPQWVQWYEWTGMLGGSFWVLLVTLLLDKAIAAWKRGHPGVGLRLATASLASVLLLSAFSLWRFNAFGPDKGPSVEVVVVQPNVDPYSEKYGGVDALEQLEDMLAQAAAVMTDSTVLVVMPETALQENATVDMSSGVPRFNGLWENDLMASRSAQRIKRFQAEHPHAAVLSGMSSDYLFPAQQADLPITARPLFREEPGTMVRQRWYESYNAALFMPVQGSVRHYHKSKLVAGVELMPFEELLGPLKGLSVDLGGTTGSLGQQQERSVLADPASGISVVPAICYESVFGEHVAAHVRNGGNVIAIMTNDAWWGDSPGYHQHLSFASLRAIETRRAIARSANTGISCFVDQRGVMRECTDYAVPDARRGRVHLNDRLTFFVRHGDVIGRAAEGASLLLLLVMIFRRIRGTARQ